MNCVGHKVGRYLFGTVASKNFEVFNSLAVERRDEFLRCGFSSGEVGLGFWGRRNLCPVDHCSNKESP